MSSNASPASGSSKELLESINTWQSPWKTSPMRAATSTATSRRSAWPAVKPRRSERLWNALSLWGGSMKSFTGPSAVCVQPSEGEYVARLKVDILDRLGRSEDAQAVRWSIFATSLAWDVLAKYLGR